MNHRGDRDEIGVFKSKTLVKSEGQTRNIPLRYIARRKYPVVASTTGEESFHRPLSAPVSLLYTYKKITGENSADENVVNDKDTISGRV